MAPGPNGWRVNPQRRYGVFNPAERRLSTPERRMPLWLAVLLASLAWAVIAGIVSLCMMHAAMAAVGMPFAGG